MSGHHDDADPRLSDDPGSERRAELLGAAAADDLSPAESQELDAMCAQDPELARELEEMRHIGSALRESFGSWREEAPPGNLRDKVIAQVNAQQTSEAAVRETPALHSPTPHAPAPRSSEPRPSETRSAVERSQRNSVSQSAPRSGSRLRQSLALAACVAVGVAGTLGVQAIVDTDPAGTDPSESDDGLIAAEPLGPPGELGAQEQVSFSDPGTGVDVEGALVAHTWGTETVLEIDGLAIGDAFTVVLIGTDGQEIESGSFLGSQVPVECRMNGAVLREDVERLEIRDDAGLAVTAAALPEVS
ncbi:anti-sigma factor family protein [Nesterenkonia sp. CF4.4]|uniref:anti-sigma factor family protein n=1 Tax=Nesterenkonia sp. CF4.4 TaxID=3373079 RepID=UPI003EE74D0B